MGVLERVVQHCYRDWCRQPGIEAGDCLGRERRAEDRDLVDQSQQVVAICVIADVQTRESGGPARRGADHRPGAYQGAIIVEAGYSGVRRNCDHVRCTDCEVGRR